MPKLLPAARSRYMLPVGFCLALVLLVAITAAGLSRMETINQRMQGIIHDQHVKTGLISVMLRTTRERSQIIGSLFEVEDSAARGEALRRYDVLGGEFSAAVGQLRALALSPEEQQALDRSLAAADKTRAVRDRVMTLLLNEEWFAARQLLVAEGVTLQNEFQESLYLLLESKRAALTVEAAKASESARNAILFIVGVGMLVLLSGGLVAWLVTRQVTRTENALQNEKELAQVTLHSIGDGVITTDAQERVEYLNPIAEHYTGWSTEQARGRPLAEVFRVADERAGRQPDFQSMAPGSAGQDAPEAVSVQLLDRSGHECPIRYSQAPIRSRDGSTVGTIVVFHDISQIRAMAQQLIWQASHDALTGLVNRREFERRLSDLIDTARSKDREHALMFMDLDNFKAVNDTCGHAAGDELLRQLTAVMMTGMRGSDTLARLGGDEFGALLESCPPEQAVRIANAMRETIREFRFVWENKTFSVGVSIGLVPIAGDSSELNNVNAVLSAADACCYEAKNKGRDRVQVYRPQDRDLSDKHSELQLVSQINRAFELGNFRLFRQRIAPLAAGAEHAPQYEILVRMLDSAGNLLPPTAFMPAAERYNLLTSIERWIISSLVEFLHREWKADAIPHAPGASGYYAVNLSGASINDKSFPDFLRNLLTRYQLPPGLLCFEITETTAISNLNKAAELMHEMKGLGCRLSLDDFGTGMSSFAYLKYLPVDYLKIAGMFVTDMATDPMDHAIVDSINRISHILGMRTVAESVEDAATLEKITALGIDYAQGYFIAEPEELAEKGGTKKAMLQPA
jgi:diguanylate cyclase (GGDEF)-like protein/PAS domain S-box-containing protein